MFICAIRTRIGPPSWRYCSESAAWVHRDRLVRLSPAEQSICDPRVRIDLESQPGVELVHFAGKLVLGEKAFVDQDGDHGVKDQRIVVIHFLQISQFCMQLNFFQLYHSLYTFLSILSGLSVKYSESLCTFHNLSIFLTRFCQKRSVY